MECNSNSDYCPSKPWSAQPSEHCQTCNWLISACRMPGALATCGCSPVTSMNDALMLKV
jgi:hypothetical protein